MESEFVFRESPIEASKVGMWTGGIRGLAAELSQTRFRIISAYKWVKLVPIIDTSIDQISRVELSQPFLSFRASLLISLRDSAWTYRFKSQMPVQWIAAFRQLGIEVVETESYATRSNGLLGMFRQ